MKVAVIGSRKISRSAACLILQHLPQNTTEIISGGADGIDKEAELVAKTLSIPLRRFLPDYAHYGKRAPLMRNIQIIEYADEVFAFWDGVSRGTMHTVAECIKRGKPVHVIPLP